MPEGPESQYLIDLIRTKYVGETLKDIFFVSGRYVNHGLPSHFNDFKDSLPLKCISAEKKGKVMFIYFEKEWCIISKLGLSGWWFPKNERPTWGTKKDTMVCTFIKNEPLIYSDQLSYGTLQFTKDIKLINNELSKISPDVLDNKTTLKYLLEKIETLSNVKKESLIEDAIIDQHLLISGIGNYLKSEILYKSRISPLRTVSSLKNEEWKLILDNSKKLSHKMLKILHKHDDDAYLNAMFVYNKKIDPLGNIISTRKTKYGRTTYWVIKLQK